MEEKKPSPEGEPKSADGGGNPAEGVSLDNTTASQDGVVDATGVIGSAPNKDSDEKPSFFDKLKRWLNIYILLFLLLVVIGVAVAVIAIQVGKKQAGTTTTQNLNEDALKDISGSDTKVGDAKSTLTIESNAVFSGKVLIRDGLDVAGPIKIGGALTLPGLTVSGESKFQDLSANTLNISGDSTLGGGLSVKNNLSVSGNGSIGGTLTVGTLSAGNLQLNDDLALAKHIDAGGGIPGVAKGTAVGGGGTVSISGTDTAGTVTANTGSSPVVGTIATITFRTPFNGTPHVVISVVGSNGAALPYYITRTSTGFTIAVAGATPMPANSTVTFDYIAID